MIAKLGEALGELKTHPALLAIVLLQCVTMTMIYFVQSGNAAITAERELALIAACQGDKQ
jgi:hypothetical protein